VVKALCYKLEGLSFVVLGPTEDGDRILSSKRRVLSKRADYGECPEL
jgi:hypothetical protein